MLTQKDYLDEVEAWDYIARSFRDNNWNTHILPDGKPTTASGICLLIDHLFVKRFISGVVCKEMVSKMMAVMKSRRITNNNYMFALTLEGNNQRADLAQQFADYIRFNRTS